MTTINSIEGVVTEINRLVDGLATDVNTLRSSPNEVNAAAIEAKIEAAAKLSDTKEHLLALRKDTERWDKETLRRA